MTALFTVEGDTYVPTEYSRGPWDPMSLHGGPVAALLARAIEHAAGDDGKRITRLTVEIERPVPFAPLDVHTEVVRAGGRVQLVDASVTAGGRLVTRARALRIRVGSLDLPSLRAEPTMPDLADASLTKFPFGEGVAFHSHGVEMRFLKGAPIRGLGPALVWMRPLVPVLEDEPLSPFQRLACAADFGNGVSAALDPMRWLFINPDLTISAVRPPQGEWIGLDSRTSIDAAGIGLAHSTLFDRHGELGRATQSLYVDTR